MDTYRGDNMLPLTLNLYMYCGGDPINYTEPTGHGFLKRLYKKLANTNTYNMYYRSGSKLATGKEASYDSMVNNMTKDPNGFAKITSIWNDNKLITVNLFKSTWKTFK